MIRSDPPRGTMRLFLECAASGCEVEVVITVRTVGSGSADKPRLLYAARVATHAALRELATEDTE